MWICLNIGNFLHHSSTSLWLLFWSQLSMNLDLFFRLIKFLFTLRYRKALNKFTWDKRKVLRFYWYFYLFSFMSLRLFLVRPVALKSGVWELYLAQICIQLYANISSHVKIRIHPWCKRGSIFINSDSFLSEYIISNIFINCCLPEISFATHNILIHNNLE